MSYFISILTQKCFIPISNSFLLITLVMAFTLTVATSIVILTASFAVMVSVLALSVVDRGFKPNTIKFAFVASPLSTQHNEKEQRLDGSESE